MILCQAFWIPANHTKGLVLGPPQPTVFSQPLPVPALPFSYVPFLPSPRVFLPFSGSSSLSWFSSSSFSSMSSACVPSGLSCPLTSCSYVSCCASYSFSCSFDCWNSLRHHWHCCWCRRQQTQNWYHSPLQRTRFRLLCCPWKLQCRRRGIRIASGAASWQVV